MERKQAVVFFSGGADSWVHLNWAIREYGIENVLALYMDFGHKYREKEIRTATLLTQYLGVEFRIEKLPLGDFENKKNAHIPLRNLFILLYGSYFADDLVFGILYNESAEDKHKPFLKMVQGLLAQQYGKSIYHPVERKVKIVTPFAHCTKTQMFQWYLEEFEGSASMLKATVGCYNERDWESGKSLQCGECKSCLDRWAAFRNNRISETYHLKMPYNWMWGKLEEFFEKNPNDPIRKFSLSLRQLWFKRRYYFEVYRALKEQAKVDYWIKPSPLTTLWNTYRRGTNLRKQKLMMKEKA